MDEENPKIILQRHIKQKRQNTVHKRSDPNPRFKQDGVERKRSLTAKIEKKWKLATERARSTLS